MHRHPWRRLLAWCIDWVCILAWVGLVAAVAVPLTLAHGSPLLQNEPLANLVAFVVVIAPATLALGVLEARSGASLGKRAASLRVTVPGSDAGPSLGRALLRNALKVALPWTLGHAAVFELAGSGSGAVPAWVVAATALAYVLPLAAVVGLFLGSGRTYYDRVCATAVRRIDEGISRRARRGRARGPGAAGSRTRPTPPSRDGRSRAGRRGATAG